MVTSNNSDYPATATSSLPIGAETYILMQMSNVERIVNALK